MSMETTASLAIQPKQHFSAKVLKTTMAGALVDIGVGVPGVVHISQIRRDPVNRVEDVLKEGDTVDVWVRRVKSDRIELTMIQPLAYEWKELKPETIVTGKVVRIEAYGAFVDFGAERPGMVHVSEMAHGFVKTPGDIVKPGDEVQAMILDVDRRKKQIRLSMKALAPEPEKIEEPPKQEHKQKRKRGKATKEETEVAETVAAAPEPTVFELAWQEAMERSKDKKTNRQREGKASNKEQDEIISRTLEKRLPTGG